MFQQKTVRLITKMRLSVVTSRLAWLSWYTHTTSRVGVGGRFVTSSGGSIPSARSNLRGVRVHTAQLHSAMERE